jgi:hypothetical protein
MKLPHSLVFPILGLVFSACSGAGIRSTEARIRLDFSAGLNADQGWADSTDITTVFADRPFRLRFEVEASEPGGLLGLETRRNGGVWSRVLARDFPYPDEISTPPVSIVSPSSWQPDTPTEDLLTTSTESFAGGLGLGLDSVSAPVPAGQSEWEWGVVIRRWADGAEMLEAGDRFDFRLVEEEGAPLAGVPPVAVQLEIPDGHLGGTYAETPGRLGPWQSNDGRLWFPMEPAETFNVLMMMSSEDGGRSWREADGAHRPLTDDLEGFATTYHGGTIHILHQISERVVYHAFNTSDAPDGSEGWTVRDELVAEHAEPPVQAASLEALHDGTLVAAFASGNQIEIRMKATGGSWTATDTLVGRSADGWILSGPQTTVTPDDVVHLAWTETNGSEGVAYHGVLSGAVAVASRQRVATGLGGTESDVGSVAPLAFLPRTNEVAIVYRRADGRLAERRVVEGGIMTTEAIISDRTVTQNAVDSDQVGADLVEHDGRLHLLFLDQETGSIYHAQSPEAGVWSTAQPVVEGIRGQWIRGQLVTKADGRIVCGFVYDAGSDGGSGMNRYGEVDLG